MSGIRGQTENLSKEEIEKITDDNPIVGRFSHVDQIKERLQLCGLYAGSSSCLMTINELNAVWDDMIESNKIVKDHQIMYKWLRSICDDVIKR